MIKRIHDRILISSNELEPFLLSTVKFNERNSKRVTLKKIIVFKVHSLVPHTRAKTEQSKIDFFLGYVDNGQ